MVSAAGEILEEHISSVPPDVDEDLLVIEVALDFITDGNWYHDGVFLPRAPFDLQISKPQLIADGVDECLITDIPAGTTVEWPDGQVDEVTDGEVAFAVDLPGTYTLTFEAVPYLRQEVTIEAVPAT